MQTEYYIYTNKDTRYHALWILQVRGKYFSCFSSFISSSAPSSTMLVSAMGEDVLEQGVDSCDEGELDGYLLAVDIFVHGEGN